MKFQYSFIYALNSLIEAPLGFPECTILFSQTLSLENIHANITSTLFGATVGFTTLN